MGEGFATDRVENWNWDPEDVSELIAIPMLAGIMKSYLSAPAKRILIQDFERKKF